jgi:hypothetical protein
MIETEDLIQPAGPIVAAMFPDDDVDTFDDRLQTYLDEGYEKMAGVVDLAAKDRGARAWALARAYDDAATAFSTMPSSASLQGLGSIGCSATAIAEWRRLAREQMALYLVEVPGETAITGDIPTSSVHPTRVIW